MKKNSYLLLFILFGCSVMSGQVAIGDPGPPHEGALLDLSKVTKVTHNREGGLLFPRVSLTNVNNFQLPGSGSTASGMVVYNMNKDVANGAGIGLYVWIWKSGSGKWIK
ncbi:MAG: hypothetical protein LBQ84_09945 [Flavobacteriaceae bacterium]|jgi:hypothetical protein|nr:hypothetical protein [Flavobacteriaceae bacterium]